MSLLAALGLALEGFSWNSLDFDGFPLTQDERQHGPVVVKGRILGPIQTSNRWTGGYHDIKQMEWRTLRHQDQDSCDILIHLNLIEAGLYIMPHSLVAPKGPADLQATASAADLSSIRCPDVRRFRNL